MYMCRIKVQYKIQLAKIASWPDRQKWNVLVTEHITYSLVTWIFPLFKHYPDFLTEYFGTIFYQFKGCQKFDYR